MARLQPPPRSYSIRVRHQHHIEAAITAIPDQDREPTGRPRKDRGLRSQKRCRAANNRSPTTSILVCTDAELRPDWRHKSLSTSHVESAGPPMPGPAYPRAPRRRRPRGQRGLPRPRRSGPRLLLSNAIALHHPVAWRGGIASGEQTIAAIHTERDRTRPRTTTTELESGSLDHFANLTNQGLRRRRIRDIPDFCSQPAADRSGSDGLIARSATKRHSDGR